MLNHFRRTRGAIHPDHVHGKHFKRGDSRGKLGAQQHGPRRFNRNLGNDGEATAGFGKTLLSRDHRGLDLEQILAGLDNQSVNSSGHQPLDLLSGRVLQIIKSDVPQGWELGPGPDGPEDKPGMLRSRIFSRGFPGNLSGFFVKLISTGLKPVIGKNNPSGRVGTPEDIAGLAIFLCSRAGQYVVGQTIACDGGVVGVS